MFGGYPFQAVEADCFLMSRVGQEPLAEFPVPGGILFLGGLSSLPVDLVVDLAAAPIDCVAWIFGFHK